MSVLDDIKNGTKPATEEQSSSGLNIPANTSGESAQSKEMPIEAAKPVLNVPEVAIPSTIPVSKPDVNKPLTYEDIFRELNPDPIPSEDDLKKEQKREKTRAIISALGDGISAISNLYSTTKGAVPVPATPTLSERNTARYNEIVNRRLKKADERKQALTNSMFMDKQQDYRVGRDKVEDQHYSDNLYYRNKQQDLAQAQYLADMNYKNLNLSLNKEKYDNQHEETKRHNQATEGIGKAKLGLEGQRVAIADRNEKRLESQYGAGGSRANKVRVVNADGKFANVDADLMSKADYWNYAKNALVQDGLLPKHSKVSDVQKFLSSPAAYEKSPKLRELREKVGTKIFQQSSAPKAPVSTAPVPRVAQPAKAATTSAPFNTSVKTSREVLNKAYESAANHEEGLKSIAKLLYKEGHTKAETAAIIKNILK